MNPKQFHIPLKPEVQDRKQRFWELNEFVRSRNGWITSVPGDVEVTIECLPGSSLPVKLRTRGYDVSATGDGERIVPTAIIERFCTGADGELELVTLGSTGAVVQVVHHAGICKVKRWTLSLASRKAGPGRTSVRRTPRRSRIGPLVPSVAAKLPNRVRISF